ncbi:molybdopterin biosynthesis protein [Tubulinosema ratisbonensis]|uniref:Molybdopterin biosynthesis protein n=1 Tax=Tubulinosema ratisbonensis TaxID=291195 RepID=A0A437AIW0_9MICR|nr:molybdopterin biosynthesis protein [Tubulinosema ratisbonensis]
MEYTTALSETETQRYSRQIILKEIGLENHKKISNTVVLVVGLGGLGSPVVTYLCTSGIKKIILADFDKVELHNLQRQTIHQENFINKFKTESAKNFINNLNSEMEVKCFTKKVNEENIEEIAKEANLLVDCTDDLNTRYVISAYAKKFGKTLIMGSVLKFAGQVYVFPKGKSCYTCLFPEFKTVRENCSSAGVLGSVCGIIGSIQATEIIKNILIDYPSYILTYDAIDNEIKKVIVRECKEMCEKINLPVILHS